MWQLFAVLSPKKILKAIVYLLVDQYSEYMNNGWVRFNPICKVPKKAQRFKNEGKFVVKFESHREMLVVYFVSLVALNVRETWFIISFYL